MRRLRRHKSSAAERVRRRFRVLQPFRVGCRSAASDLWRLRRHKSSPTSLCGAAARRLWGEGGGRRGFCAAIHVPMLRREVYLLPAWHTPPLSRVACRSTPPRLPAPPPRPGPAPAGARRAPARGHTAGGRFPAVDAEKSQLPRHTFVTNRTCGRLWSHAMSSACRRSGRKRPLPFCAIGS